MTAPAYPLPRPAGNDPRFTFGLLLDVVKTIEAHGFPPVGNSGDLADLNLALYRFLYASDGRPAARDGDQPQAARGHVPDHDGIRMIAQRAEMHLDLTDESLTALAIRPAATR